MNCFIVEDEPLARKILMRYINETDGLILTGYAKSSEEAFDFLQKNETDLIFLDINLPDFTGIELYKSLTHKPNVIFTTAYSEYAVEGFELDAIDYLLKPVSYDRFLKSIEKVKKKTTSNKEQILTIKQDKKHYRINLDNIFHIESIGDYVKIHALHNTYISNDTLKNLINNLPGKKFMRVHKSHIIGVDFIEFLEGNRIRVKDKNIPVGQSYREEVAHFFGK